MQDLKYAKESRAEMAKGLSISATPELAPSNLFMSDADNFIQKHATITLYQPTKDNTEKFLNQYIKSEIKSEKCPNFSSSVHFSTLKYVKVPDGAISKEKKISDASGFIEVKILKEKIQIPFLIRDGELLEFDVIRRGKSEMVPYSAENLEKILIGLKEMQEKPKDSQEFDTPFIGVEKRNTTLTSPGFMNGMLKIKDMLNRAGRMTPQVAMSRYADTFTDLMEKSARTVPYSDEEIQRTYEALRAVEQKTREVKFETLERNQEKLIPQAEKDNMVYRDLKGKPYTNVLNRPHGTIISFPESKHGMIKYTRAVIVKNFLYPDEMIAGQDRPAAFDDFTIQRQRRQSSVVAVLTEDNRIAYLRPTDSFFGVVVGYNNQGKNEQDKKDGTSSLSVNTASFEALRPGIPFVVFKNGRMIPTSSVRDMPTGEEVKDLRQRTELGKFYETMIERKTGHNPGQGLRKSDSDDRYFDGADKNIWLKKPVLASVSLVGGLSNPISVMKPLGNYPDVGTQSMDWRILFANKCRGLKIKNKEFVQGYITKKFGVDSSVLGALDVERDKPTLFTNLDNLVIPIRGTFKVPATPADLEDIFACYMGMDLNKVAAASKKNGKIQIECINRATKKFNVLIFFTGEKGFSSNLRKEFLNISEAKTRAIMRILKFDMPTVQTYIARAKNTSYVSLQLPDTATKSDFDKLQGGVATNLSKQKIKGQIKSFIDPTKLLVTMSAAVTANALAKAMRQQRFESAHKDLGNTKEEFQRFKEKVQGNDFGVKSSNLGKKAESEQLCMLFEKYAQEYKSEDFLNCAKLARTNMELCDRIDGILSEEKIYKGIEVLADEIIKAEDGLGKVAASLIEYKTLQFNEGKDLINPNHLSAMVRNIEDLYKNACSISDAAVLTKHLEVD